MSEATLRPAADVAFAVMEDVVFVARIPSGPMTALQGSGGVIWQEALCGERRGIAARVAARSGTRTGDIEDQVEAYLTDLVTRGFLVEEPVPITALESP